VSVKIKAPKGTKDTLPSDQPTRRAVTNALEGASERAGYGRISVPTFEDTALFARSAGDGSDVVQKEMYAFDDRAGRSLTLRPEATAQVCRAYLEHGLHRSPLPFKAYYTAPMFRYAAPQKGRLREFWQVGAEAIGTDDPAVDTEIIAVVAGAFAALGLSRIRLDLNSIGCADCRKAYLVELGAFLEANESVLDEDARGKVRVSPLRVFDTKNEKLRARLAEAPLIGDHLCTGCREHFDEVRRFLDALGVTYSDAPRLVRGLDYYTRTVFEFVDEELDAAQSTICAGGRYDGLIEELGGKATPAVGFAAGVERIVLALEQREIRAGEPGAIDVFFVFADATDRSDVLTLMNVLRRTWVCETDYAHRSLKGQMTQASRLGARLIVVCEASQIVVRERGQEDVTVNEQGELAALLEERLQ
jgi:histidyl-tRNA synthetase